jgi:uncharacterized protein
VRLVRQLSGPFTISLASLEEGVNHLRLEGRPDEAGIEPDEADLTGPIVLEGDFIRADSQVEIQARLRTAVRLVCDRCLAELERGIDASVRLLFEKRGRRRQPGPAEKGADQDGLMYYDGRTLDLAEEIRQVVLLEVPWHPLCRVDCKGLCPQCGKDRNLGDCGCAKRQESNRWTTLRKLIEVDGRPSDASQEEE